MLDETVADSNGIRGSSVNFWPTVLRSPMSKVKIAGSALVSRQTRSAIFVTAMAVSGGFSDGVLTAASPQSAARAAFHAPTALGITQLLVAASMPRGRLLSI